MPLTLPVVFHILGLALPAHMVMESLAYIAGFRLYLLLRQAQTDSFSDSARLTVMVGAIIGAALGSKLLGFLEHPELWPLAMKNPLYFLAAKTILGGLLGGIIGVEIAKALTGIRRSTGDIYVFPLLAAIMIGRIGCLLTGVSDGTWGDATSFFMAYDAGDGVLRHPTPLYEILFLVALGILLYALRRRGGLAQGDLFKVFIMAYCGWRFFIEFLKPVTTYAFFNLNIVQFSAKPESLSGSDGLSAIQMAALLGLIYYAGWFIWRGRALWQRGITSFSN